MELLAHHAPRPDVADSMRRIPEHRSLPAAIRVSARVQPPSAADTQRDAQSMTGHTQAACATDAVRELARAADVRSVDRHKPTPPIPLSPSLYKLTFTITERVRDKLQEAQDLLRHAIPNGELEQVFERALDLLIAERKKQRFGKTHKPRKHVLARATQRSRYIPRDVRRQVWDRCGGRCSFVTVDGERCTSRSFLEFHHIEPYGRGGLTTAENLSLVCKSHNALFAERDYGRELIASRVSVARSTIPNAVQS
jgi:hypothetical protein